MSESDGEQAARSVALEQAYVHDVYEQCADKTNQSKHWPRIYEFLEELEPGALVCDIGCGNGKYLNVNHSIFKVGVDRCKRLTDIAREKENEVLVCDNLALPFRDESFDAVLSVAVVHHFATTERRVHALKELARVLRIGGRLVISVWAMEQKHRKFESQDVLVPWPKTFYINAMSDGSTYPGILNVGERQIGETAQKYLTISKRTNQGKSKNKNYWMDPLFSSSPSTSSLSSPNETCYSFFRRALQKLARGRRGSSTRTWFLESWQNGNGKSRRHYGQNDSADVDELPIELRRLEDGNMTLSKQCDSLSMKSKSLGNILDIQHLDLVRSRSSIPGLCSTITSDLNLSDRSGTLSLCGSKPRLVKQKSYFVDDIGLENSQHTATEELIMKFPDLQITPSHYSRRGIMPKQSSMNEELMSTERLEEKERLRRNIMKQASLNEEIICKRKTFESLKDSIYIGNATKRFHLLKSGLTNKLKQSTTNIEKVSSMSIKNGFVRIFQGWKSTENESTIVSNTSNDEAILKLKITEKLQQPTLVVKQDTNGIERRLSREDGSDSSKDSSLQSDTSVDSEDSFASVIYVPKQDAATVMDMMPTPSGYQLNNTSAPPSPRVTHPPDISTPRIKLISISPLLKPFPVSTKSLPFSNSSTTPRTLTTSDLTPDRSVFTTTTAAATGTQQSAPADNGSDVKTKNGIINNANHTSLDLKCLLKEDSQEHYKISMSSCEKSGLEMVCGYLKSMADNAGSMDAVTIEDTAPLIPSPDKLLEDTSIGEFVNEADSRKARLNQIKELLKQKPGFATRAKSSFPLVRRASTAAPGRLETVTKVLPRLLSLELFNPETDDLDSDSSGVSSPESVSSVISVISDHRHPTKKDNAKSAYNVSNVLDNSNDVNEESKGFRNASAPSNGTFTSKDESVSSTVNISQNSNLMVNDKSCSENSMAKESKVVEELCQCLTAQPTPVTTQHMEKLMNNGANSTGSTLMQIKSCSNNTYLTPVETTWNEECRQHLIDFTEKLSENLMQKIDEYSQKLDLEFNGKACQTYKLDDCLSSEETLANVPCNINGKYMFDSNSCKYNESANTISWLNRTNNVYGEKSDIEKLDNKFVTLDGSSMDGCYAKENNNEVQNVLIHRSASDDAMDFVLVSQSGEFINEKESLQKQDDISLKKSLFSDYSTESGNLDDSIENTISESGFSQESNDKFYNGSTVSLFSNTTEQIKTTVERRAFHAQGRSASEEIPSQRSSDSKRNSECLITTTTASKDTLSGSSSQESFPSDRGGGAITYHQYYHVFREGELDHLINTYVENLHIISSYYDHASWCIVAEKVQVWTI